jgi:hypothetical protein
VTALVAIVAFVVGAGLGALLLFLGFLLYLSKNLK